jgi:Mlc titration factor MtfA (ptsG expression regulator)
MEVATAPISAGVPILGQIHQFGPIILTWDAARRGARHPELGHNVVFHEFAHALDLLDGAADGTPGLANTAEYARWAEVCSTSFAALRGAAQRHRKPSVLDPYGATNEAEFFAVATEAFFDIPRRLRAAEPELYALLTSFYRQDPAARTPPGDEDPATEGRG